MTPRGDNAAAIGAATGDLHAASTSTCTRWVPPRAAEEQGTILAHSGGRPAPRPRRRRLGCGEGDEGGRGDGRGDRTAAPDHRAGPPQPKPADTDPPGRIPNPALNNDPFRAARRDPPSDGSGPLAGLGPHPRDGVVGPQGPLFGDGGNAGQIIFVCDATTSMLGKMAAFKNELQKAVEGLEPVQSFNIVFFQDQRCAALDNSSMVPATPDNKGKAYYFLDDVTTTKVTDPMPGLTLAFGQHPQLVYLLTDGDFPDNKAVEAKINELNRDHKTKVNTIAYHSGNGDPDDEFVAVLQQIAKENGGSYRRVSENDLTQ